jgi:hypothetical protein
MYYICMYVCILCVCVYVCMCVCILYICMYLVYVHVCIYVFFKSLLTSMLHYIVTILHAKSFLLQSPVTPVDTVYIYSICQSLVMLLKFLFTKCPYVPFTTSKNILLEFTIYKVSKFIEFTNFWENFVYLFAKSELVVGQFPPAFAILFLRTCLCFRNSPHSHSKWSVVCGLILQRHVGSSMTLNLRKYDLSLPCPVTVADKFMHICSLFDILSFTIFKNVVVSSPLFEASHSLCHTRTPFYFNSLVAALFGILM